MFVYQPKNRIELTPEQQEEMYWDDWVHNSHRWVEKTHGYYVCDYCNKTSSHLTPLGSMGLCDKNPILLKTFET